MDITITAIHCDISDATKDYVREKLSKLDKYFDKARKTSVAIHAERGDYSVELNCSATRGRHFTVHVHSEGSVQEAIDLAHDKMAKQLRRYKGKLRSHKGKGNREKLVRDIKRVTQRLEEIAMEVPEDMDLQAELEDVLHDDEDE